MGNNITSISGEVHSDIQAQHQYQAEEDDVFYDTFTEDDQDRVPVGQRLQHRHSNDTPTHAMAPPLGGVHATPQSAKDHHLTLSIHKNNDRMTTDHEDEHMMTPSRQRDYVMAPPREGNHVMNQPRQDDNGLAPPRQDDHVIAPPRQDDHGVAPPRQDHVIAPPHEDDHGVAPPRQDDQVVAAPRQDDQVVAPPRQYNHMDDLPVIWRYTSFTSEPGNTSIADWEEDVKDPFEKIMARRGAHKTVIKTEEKTLEQETRPVLQPTNKLQVGGNQQLTEIQQQHPHDEEQDSITEQHFDDRKQEQKAHQQQVRTLQHYPDDQQQDPYSVEEHDSKSKQYRDGEQEESRSWHLYKYVQQDRRTPRFDDSENEEDSTPQHCSKGNEEQDRRPWKYYMNIEQYNRSQDNCTIKGQDSKLWHRDEYIKTVHQCESEEEDQDNTSNHSSSNNEKQDPRPWHHYKDEHQVSKAQNLYNVKQQDPKTRLNYLHKDQHHDEKNTRSQQCGEDHYSDEGQASTSSHHHNSENETSKAPSPIEEVKHRWDRSTGKGRECISDGEQQTRQPDAQGGSHQILTWMKKEADVQYEDPLSWRHNARNTNKDHPQHSRGYWYQKQQQHHSTYYHKYNSHDASALNTLNANVYKDKGDILELDKLVNVLGERPKYYSTFLNLHHYQSLVPESVQKLATSHPHIFHMSKDGVQLQPQIKLCKAHVSRQGCVNGLSCHCLHICNTYISSWCSESPCRHSHSLYSQHNRAVLKMFGLETLPVTPLKKLIRHLMLTVAPPLASLDVCREYNRGNCENTDCQALHLCLQFVRTRGRCDRPNCNLTHNPLDDKTCCLLLTTHGISTNETIMDIIMAILNANPSLIPADAKSLQLQSFPDTRTTSEDMSPKKQSTLLNKVKQKFGFNSDSLKNEESFESYSPESRQFPSQGSLYSNSSGTKLERKKKSSDTKSEKDEDSDQGSNKRASHRPKKKTLLTMAPQVGHKVADIQYGHFIA